MRLCDLIATLQRIANQGFDQREIVGIDMKMPSGRPPHHSDDVVVDYGPPKTGSAVYHIFFKQKDC